MSKVIYLIGYMGSGKSTFGKKLAKQFELSFYDLDREIELKEGRSINAIFEEEGEKEFREIEAEVLRNIPQVDRVVATGGGTPIYKDNMQFMKSNGVVAYLVVPYEILLGRLRKNKAKRPLIKDLNDEELQKYLFESLEKRKMIYGLADILIPHTKSFNLLKMELQFLL